jgi:hypothetical protein
MEKAKRQAAPVQWEELLREAVEQPGLLLRAYSAFHNYSLGNQVAAIFQCYARGIEIGPINTFKGWEQKGRRVCKGEKALWLCMPYTKKRMGDNDEEKEEFVITGFDWKPRWFTLHQTEKVEATGYTPFQEVPELVWNKARALAGLDIAEIPFSHINGNCQGYACRREIAVSPLAALPYKTLVHEIAHVVLGHTEQGECSDGAELPKSLREVEAEGVAYLLCHSLGWPGAEYSRGYIQHWLVGAEIPETNARRIFSAADKILKAGRL